MNKLIVLAFVAACASVARVGGAQTLRVHSPLQPEAVQGDLPGGVVVVRPELGQVRGLLAGIPVEIQGFPLGPARTAELRVSRFDVLASDATVFEGTDAGDVPMRWPDVVLLRGTVSGAAKSRVYLGLSPTGCNGFIEADGELFIIAGKQGEPTVVYSTAQLPPGLINLDAPTCGGAIEGDGDVPGADPLESPAGASPPCRTVRVALDGDFEYFRDVAGSNATTGQAYMVTLLGGVSEIYRTNLNVNIQVGFSRVWSTSADPYPSGSVGNSLLNSMRSYWNTNMTGVPRNDAVLLSSSARSGGAGGIAFLSSLCQGGNSYSVTGFINGSFPNPLATHNSGNWDLVVVAHEMGHNFGAQHTHSLVPAVDGCGSTPQDCSLASQGTIMSYCHTCSGGVSNIALNFHQRNIDENMLPYLAGGAASCIQPGSCAAIVDVNARTGCSAAGGLAQITLGPGNYALQPVGVADGAAYNAWSPSSANAGCTASTGCCTQGYVWRYEYNTGGTTWNPVGVAGCNFSTDTAAFAAESATANFTLASQTIVSMRVSDTACTDNRGGISLRPVKCPTITFSPPNKFFCGPISSTFFGVSYTGDDVAFQWYRDGQALVNDGHISGATAYSVTISHPVLADAGEYVCVVSNGCGSVSSTPARLSLSNFGPFIVSPPVAASVNVGQQAQFSVGASGVGTITYQWRKGGVNLTDSETVSGTQASTLVIASASVGNAGTYDCVTRDTCGQATTTGVALAVSSPCPADFNGDGTQNPDDLGDYITCFFTDPPCAEADFNQDGEVNPDDLGDYITSFFGPGC